jgi:hypothetical protein
MLKDDKTRNVFKCLARIEIGNGRSVWFWKDRWIAGLTTAEIAPLIAGQVPTRRKNKRTVAKAMRDSRWILDIAGGLSEEGSRQYVKL